MSDSDEDPVLGGLQEDPTPGPIRRITQAPHAPAASTNMSPEFIRDNARLQRFHLGLRPDRTPRPSILGHRQPSTLNPQAPRNSLPVSFTGASISATATQLQTQRPVTTTGVNQVVTQAQLNMLRPLLRFPDAASFNAHLARALLPRQPLSGLAAAPPPQRNIRPVPPASTQTTASALVQAASLPQIIRTTSFEHPRTHEIMGDLYRQAAHGNASNSMPAPGTSKRQGSPTGPPASKRHAPNTLRTIPYPQEIMWDTGTENDFLCPLCFEQFREPHITQCGHTFCLSCIDKFLLVKTKCPNCSVEVRRANIAPNRAIHHLMRKQALNARKINTEVHMAAANIADNGDAFDDLDVYSFFQKKYDDLSMGEVDVLMSMLSRKKEVLFTESEECRRSLILDFLTELQRLKEAELKKVLDELTHINSDLAHFPIQKEALDDMSGGASADKTKERYPAFIQASSEPTDGQPGTSSQTTTYNLTSNGRLPIKDIHFNATDKELRELQPSVAQRKLKIHSHFDSLSAMYWENYHPSSPTATKEEVGGVKTMPRKDLQDFTDALVRISRYSSFKLLATLSYTSESLANTNIVSTIEFDKDRDFFAIAGVTKKIRLFEYGSVIASAVKMQTPNGEIACTSKISCVSYSCFYKSKLASSDYDGKVNIYDTSTCETVSTLNEHEKRVWSVDFSDADPRFLVSGSDDCKVKLWSVTQQNSGTTIQTNANVCCVKFVPGSSYTIACGSADHCIHYYDFRQPKTPLRIYEGHKKAVSYVKFASNTELISASTDSNLKLWSLNARDCVRSYTGHVNDKNFVGLTTDGSYVACGSENNSIYVYYKDLPYPLLNYKFENYRSMIHPVRQDEVTSEFVSAVAWRTGSPVIVAANSQGIIKVLELV